MPSATSSDYLSQKQMDFILKGTGWTSPTSIYVGLFTTAPNLDGTSGVEVSTTSTAYGRVAIPQGGWTGPSGANLEYSNTNQIDFSQPTADWGLIVAICLFDSDIGGTNNLLFVSNLQTSKQVSNGDGSPSILAGQLRISRATC